MDYFILKRNKKMKNNCYKKDNDGMCCCNCANQKKLMCHPMNMKTGKGSIIQQFGWICVMEFEDESNKDCFIFFDNKHGLCEMYNRK